MAEATSERGGGGDEAAVEAAVEAAAAEEAALVRRAQAGDGEAFAALVRRFLRLGGSIAYQVLGDYDRASDAVQDAFIRVQRSLPGLREPERFRSWFYGVVRSVAIDRARRERRWQGMARIAGGTEESGERDLEAAYVASREVADPLGPLVASEDGAAIREAVNALPESYREVIALKYLDERSYEEIAALLGTSVEAVESKLHRARGKLRQKLQGLARRSGWIES